MPKLFKKLFKNNILNNERGSSLAITIIVVAVLAFSVTSLTKMTVNLSGATTAELNAVNDESIGKGVITAAITEYEAYVREVKLYTGFTTSLPVTYSDVTSLFPLFGVELFGSETKVIKFEYALNNGDTIYKEVYISKSNGSTGGSSLDSPHPYDFSIATEGDLILNGGIYDDVNIYGKNIYLGNVAPFTVAASTAISGWTTYAVDAEDFITTGNNGTFPAFSEGDNDSKIFYSEDYKYCTGTCFSVEDDSSEAYTINKNNYTDVEGSSLNDQGDIQNLSILDFFNQFDFNEYLEYITTEVGPTGNQSFTADVDVDTFISVIRANSDYVTRNGNGNGNGNGGGWGWWNNNNNNTNRWRYPNEPYADVSRMNIDWDSGSQVVLETASVFDCAEAGVSRLLPWDGLRMENPDTEALVVIGDMEISNWQNYSEEIEGTFIVTGDLYFTGKNIDFTGATFIVFGETFFDFEDGSGFYTTSNDTQLAVYSYDNIQILNDWNSAYTTDPSNVTGLLYTEESIYVDAIPANFEFEGLLLARASDRDSHNPINVMDQDGNDINGIMINSYKGYVSEGYAWAPGGYLSDVINTVSFVPSNNIARHRFEITQLDQEEIFDRFFNIPGGATAGDDIPGFENILITEGVYTFEISEFKID